MAMTYVHNYYDNSRNWEENKPGWYTIELLTKSEQHHLEMVQWLYDNVDNPERHCRWIYLLTTKMNSGFKFRYERDYLWFRLTWE